MKQCFAACLFSFGLTCMVMAQDTPAVVPPWQTGYSGTEATGDDVIALWQFGEQGDTVADRSGNGHTLTLRGQSRIASDGRFGRCLESFPADRENDHPQGGSVPRSPHLSPSGAFSIDLWAKLKPEATDYRMIFLVDKKNYYYASELSKANRDYCFYLVRVGNGWRLTANLGFGKDSDSFSSGLVSLDDAWHHVAMTYDGAGTVGFYLDGRKAGEETAEGRGAVAAGNYPLVIGDRVGSIHKGFPGFLDQVRLCRGVKAFFSGELTVQVSEGRRAFMRMEPNAEVALTVGNDTGRALEKGDLRVTVGGDQRRFPIAALASGERRDVTLAIDTGLRPDRYVLQAEYRANAAGLGPLSSRLDTEVHVLPRQLPHQMPVVMWGTGEAETVADIGFTHQLHWMGYFDGAVYREREPVPGAISEGRRQGVLSNLDNYMAHGIGAVLKLYPGSWMARHDKVMETYQRVDREGNPRDRTNVCALFPDIPDYGYDVGATVMQAFGHMPGVKACMIHSEIRDGTAPCFHEHDREAFRQAAGVPIPEQVTTKRGVRWQELQGFPSDRVISSDHPILAYYRWFWKEGDGWNAFHTSVHRGLKSTGRRDVWTYHDPAVRVPSIWGSGGDVDVISQWTYSYPDPIKIGQAADELFAMAAGKPGQGVMKMTQIIWKRFQTTLRSTPQDALAEWERQQPDAKYYTIAPDHLRIAFWSKISRPVRGIMYHGWGSLVPPADKSGSYRYTHPETLPALEELIHTVIRPLGPTLLQVPDAPADVAILESFTSQMFAGRGTYGWSNGWEADVHLVLQWAHLQPKIVYEETILRDRLQGVKVLVMPNCDVLTEPLVAQIQAFQDDGGIIVADERVSPAIFPDIQLSAYRRTGKADQDKAALQALAARLRDELDTVYARSFEASSPDLVLRQRRYGDTDYLFAINDHRTFGNYVGHHGKVMEKGVPLNADVTLERAAAAVYDLIAQRDVPVRMEDERVSFHCESRPGEGHLYMVCQHPIGGVSIAAPEHVSRGDRANVTVTVTNTAVKPMRAVVPVRLEIVDPDGREAEYSGFYGARDGMLRVALDMAENDRLGTWRVVAAELASGKTARHTFTLE